MKTFTGKSAHYYRVHVLSGVAVLPSMENQKYWLLENGPRGRSVVVSTHTLVSRRKEQYFLLQARFVQFLNSSTTYVVLIFLVLR